MRAPRGGGTLPQSPAALPWVTGARLKSPERSMPRRRSRRRGVDYDLKERLTGRTLQYLDVDYLASTGALINTTKYITLSKRKTAQKLLEEPARARLPR